MKLSKNLEVVSKPHLTSNYGVAALLKMLTYAMYAALFRRATPCPWMRSEVLKSLLSKIMAIEKRSFNHSRWINSFLVFLSIGFFIVTGCRSLKPLESHTDDNLSPLSSIIRFYQGPLNHLSTVHIGECPMEPSCSEYALQAIQKHGMLLSWFMTCDRLMRCGRDELALSPEVLVYGKWKCFDPLDQNDDWWTSDLSCK